MSERMKPSHLENHVFEGTREVLLQVQRKRAMRAGHKPFASRPLRINGETNSQAKPAENKFAVGLTSIPEEAR